MSASRLSAAAAGPVAPWDQAKRSGRSATQRPHRMHLPWSTRTGSAVMAPVGHRAVGSTGLCPTGLAGAGARFTRTGPRQPSA